jgi:hypothetical protein
MTLKMGVELELALLQFAVEGRGDHRAGQGQFHAVAALAVAAAGPAGVDQVDVGAVLVDPFAQQLGVTAGGQREEGSPKQVEKVASGSVTPRSVPASLAV